MKTTYANMVGSICLDKAKDRDGNPAPVTFSVRKVINGNKPWSQQGGNMTLYQGADTLAWAVKELHHRFEMQMGESGFELRIEGRDYDVFLDDFRTVETKPYKGESGWYDLHNNGIIDLANPSNNRADYPLSSYPLKWEDWVKNEVHSFAYDDYTVCIVTSNGDLVY